MIVLRGPWQTWPVVTGPTSMAIGVMDGVHIGHRALLSRLDRSAEATVLTFEPHPVEVLRPGTPPRLITSLEERLARLESAGIDCVGVLDLSEIKELSPEDFVKGILVDRMRLAHLVVGEDFRFGKDRTGDVALLERMGTELGFVVETTPLVTRDEIPVSSSRIRELIESGDVSGASELLDSWFTITNVVVDGDKRGRQIGFPTANLRPPARKVIPARGVYACFATVAGEVHDAAVNVGVRPTFGGGELLVEAFILDFDEDIYGNDLSIEFVQYLRPELEFSGVEDLVARMEQDVVDTRASLDQVRSGI